MKEYFIQVNSQQQGPYTLEELKNKSLRPDTYVWHEGLTEWTKAELVEDLRDVFKKIPPPLPNQKQEFPKPTETPVVGQQKKSSPWRTVFVIIVILIASIAGFVIFKGSSRSGAGSLLNVTINPPNPVVLSSYSKIDPDATILDYKQAVYATILNKGGSGRVLITTSMQQGSHHWEETKEEYFSENESKEVHIMFDQPKALGGEIQYNIHAEGIN